MMNKNEQLAHKYFTEGYNCAQSVFAAFHEEMGMDEKEALRLSSAFGGGMGRLREVCGAVSGMFMVLGALYGYDDAKNDEAKKLLYTRVQNFANEFKSEYGTIICRELIGAEGAQKPTPTPRNPEFYEKRPCTAFVVSAARIMSEFIEENK